MVSGFDNTLPGTQTLTVTYLSVTTTFEIEVISRTLIGINITKVPDKTYYISGDSLDLLGGELELYFDNDTVKTIALTENIISGFNTNDLGRQVLTVSYGGFSNTFDVFVVARDSFIHIEVSVLPVKLEYLEGKDGLDVTGGKVKLYYDYGITDEIDMTADMISGFDNTKVGQQTLTVSYGGKTAAFGILVVAKTVSRIQIASFPTKTAYLEGKEELDVSGGKITVYYDNNETETIDMTTDMISGFDNGEVGQQTLTVTYGAKTAMFRITVVSADSFTMIEVSQLPQKTIYVAEDDLFDPAYGKIKLYYPNGITDEIDLTADMVSGFDNTKIGEQTLTVTYGGKTTTFRVEIVSKTVLRISVMTLPAKTSYLEGKETLDVAGGSITVYYNNDTSEVVVMTADMVSGFDNKKVGQQTLTVTYGGKTATFNVTIVAKSPARIAVTTLPFKTSYLEGKETFSAAGGKVTLYYNNDTSDEFDLAADMVSGFDNTRIGEQLLTAVYGGFTTTFMVQIVAKTLTGIAMTALPSKASYLEGKDELNVTGGKLALTYNNDTSEIVDMTVDMVSGFDNTVVGVQTLTVAYGGFTDTFDITIIAKTLSRIAVTTLPTKTSYIEGKEELNVAGGKVTLYYNNDTSEVVAMTADMVSGFDNSKVGQQTLTVAYGGKTVTFDVTIVDKELAGIAVYAKPSKREYLEGKDAFEVVGGKVTLLYNNDTSEIIEMTAQMITGFDNTNVGRQTLTVTYGGFTATFDVTIIAKTLTGIAVAALPSKTDYLESKDAFTVEGGKVTLYYNNDTSKVIAMTADMISGFDNTVVGVQTLTVAYGGFTDTFDITIIAKTLSRIAVTTLPTKTSYLEGKDKFDVDGGVITLYFDNSTTREAYLAFAGGYKVIFTDTGVLEPIDIGGFDNSKPGVCPITVTYGGFSTSFNVTIAAKAVSGITITSAPDKTEYEAGEALNINGCKVNVNYNNGTVRTAYLISVAGMYRIVFDDNSASEEVAISGFSSNIGGKKTVKVSYKGYSDSFEVTVNGSIVTKGDADGDGEITVADALSALRVAAKLVEATPDMVAICDTDGDGEITVADALAILRVAAKLVDSL